MTRFTVTVAGAAGLALLAAGFMAAPALALGSGSSGGGSGGSSGGSKPACSSFTTKSTCQTQAHCYWSSSSDSCKTRRNQLRSSADQERYQKAVALIEDEKFGRALAVLKTIEQRQEPNVLNYIGYTTRKLGDVDKGISYYREALKIDPDFVLAREYLGEGYLQKGEVGKAREQLTEIAARCGTDCREYAELSNAIVEHVTGVKLGKDW